MRPSFGKIVLNLKKTFKISNICIWQRDFLAFNYEKKFQLLLASFYNI